MIDLNKNTLYIEITATLSRFMQENPMLDFTIGQVKISVGLGRLNVVAPIAGKTIQLDVNPVQNTAKTKFMLFVDGKFTFSAEVQLGDAIPF